MSTDSLSNFIDDKEFGRCGVIGLVFIAADLKMFGFYAKAPLLNVIGFHGTAVMAGISKDRNNAVCR